MLSYRLANPNVISEDVVKQAPYLLLALREIQVAKFVLVPEQLCSSGDYRFSLVPRTSYPTYPPGPDYQPVVQAVNWTDMDGEEKVLMPMDTPSARFLALCAVVRLYQNPTWVIWELASGRLKEFASCQDRFPSHSDGWYSGYGRDLRWLHAHGCLPTPLWPVIQHNGRMSLKIAVREKKTCACLTEKPKTVVKDPESVSHETVPVLVVPDNGDKGDSSGPWITCVLPELPTSTEKPKKSQHEKRGTSCGICGEMVFNGLKHHVLRRHLPWYIGLRGSE